MKTYETYELKTTCVICDAVIHYKKTNNPTFALFKDLKPTHCDPCYEKIKTERKEHERFKKVSMMTNESNIPKQYFDGDNIIAHKKTEHQEKAIHMYGNTNGLYIWGPIGTGKTYISCAIIMNEINKYIPAKFVHSSMLFEMSLYTRSAFGDEERDKRTALAKVPYLLVIDDIANHAISRVSIGSISEVLNYRLNYSCPTIITSNYNPLELAKKLKKSCPEEDWPMCDAIADRILALCVPVKINGESFRVKEFIRKTKETENG